MLFDSANVPLEIGYYLAGFTDGEGSFNCSFRRRPDYKAGWKISVCFNVSQKEEAILKLFQKYLECGTLRSRPDGIWYYEVNNLQQIIHNVIPFFNKFSFLSKKKKNDFEVFCKIVQILESTSAQTRDNIQAILVLRNQMNGGGKRKFTDNEILLNA